MLLPGGVEGVLRVLQLGLQSAENLKVAGQLRGHLSNVLSLELPNSVLLLSKTLASSFQLALEKLSGVFRLLLAYLQVLVDEQVR